MAEIELCAAPGCGKPARRNRYRACSMHEARIRRGGSWDRRVERQSLSEILGGKMLFGLWQVLGEGEPYRRKRTNQPMRQAICRCACGVERLVQIQILKSGQSRHCGCRQAIINDANHLRHGDTRRGRTAVEHRTWSKMIARCENPNDPDYADYGGRGIVVCERWREDYVAFLADMGRRPAGHSIDRIDVDGNYEPGNCRWATKAVQARNKRNTRYVEWAGERRPLKEACEMVGIDYKLAHSRLQKGWPIERALGGPNA